MRVRYQPKGAFHNDLQREVAAVVAELRPATRPALLRKTAMVAVWFYGSYLVLVLTDLHPWQAALAAASLGVSGASVAMGTSHDALHGNIARTRRGNAVLAVLTVPFGISRRWWEAKHNHHHAYTNVEAIDDDLHFGARMRLSPSQPWRPWHRYQHIYVWFLYPFLHLGMVTSGDMRFILFGRIGSRQVFHPRLRDTALLLFEKVTPLALLLSLALWMKSPWSVVTALVGASCIVGFVESVTFQLGHCLDTTRFVNPDPTTGLVDTSWAHAQVAGTADVAVRNRLYTWYVSGLNLHIEHHLAPGVEHSLLPDVVSIVRRVCAQHHVAVTEFPSIRSAVRSHQRHLKHLGRDPRRPSCPSTADLRRRDERIRSDVSDVPPLAPTP